MKLPPWAATAAAFTSVAVLSAASLLYSCASAPPGASLAGPPRVTINLSQSAPGVWPSIERLAAVESVARWDKAAQRAVPLEPGTWTFDPAQARFEARWPSMTASDTLVVRGTPTRPRRLHLGQFEGTPAQLFVVLGSHRALADFEYQWDAGARDLVFRDDLDLEGQTYFVSYPTAQGSASYGNRPFDATFALLQAQWVQEQVERIRQEQGGEYDLDLTDPQHPAVVLRPGTAQPSGAPQVSEPRFGPQEESLGAELGLRLGRPTELRGTRVYRVNGSFLESQTRGGVLFRWASQWYDAGDGQPLIVEVSKVPLPDATTPAWVIAVQTFADRGVQIRATEAWALVTEGSQKPRPGKTVTFDWLDQGQAYRLSLPEGLAFDEGATLVRAYRQGR